MAFVPFCAFLIYLVTPERSDSGAPTEASPRAGAAKAILWAGVAVSLVLVGAAR